MPIYEYECEDCQKVIEKWHSINDVSPDICECGGKLSKIISRTTFHLKGGGWYVTDYCKRNSNDSSCESEKTSKNQDSSDKSASVSKETSISDASGASNQSSPSQTTAAQTSVTT